jgi:hypothetical protein
MRLAHTTLLVVLLLSSVARAPAQTLCDFSAEHPLSLLADAIRLVEPSLPVLLNPSRLALPPEHPAYHDLRYLRQRRVIPADAVVDPLTPEVWGAALSVVSGWYRIPPVASGDPNLPGVAVRDVQGLIGSVANAVRPLALIAWEPGRDSQLAFLGLVWNWSVYPRLIVFRENQGMVRNLGVTARTLSNCAYPVNDYVAASAPVARDLFLAQDVATMYIVGSEPDPGGRWPEEVPAGEELAVFAFEHPLVADVRQFSAVFIGDPAPVLTFVRLLPQLRTNLSPLGIPRVLAVPPQ